MFGMIATIGALSLIMATLASERLEYLTLFGATVLLIESILLGAITMYLVLLASGFIWTQIMILAVAGVIMYASYRLVNKAEKEGWLWNS